MDKELWKDIPGYEGLYKASTTGKIYSSRAKKCLAISPNTAYETVTLHNKGKHKSYGVHRLVAMTFLPNPHNLPQVHHIDGNHHNNTISNLQWITREDNQTEYFNSEYFKKKFTKENMVYFMMKKDSGVREYDIIIGTGTARNITTGEIKPLSELKKEGYVTSMKYINEGDD